MCNVQQDEFFLQHKEELKEELKEEQSEREDNGLLGFRSDSFRSTKGRDMVAPIRVR